MKKKNCATRMRAQAALVIGLLATFPQTATALKHLPTTAEFESSRQALQADLRQRSVVAKSTAEPRASQEALLGERLYSDKTLSLLKNQSCASCHQLAPARNPATGLPLPAPGFVDAENVEHGTAVSRGSVPGLFGKLNTPSAGYAAFSPSFHWDAAEGLYVGGQFWNGRSSTLADQAGQPFLNPAEMAMPSKAAVVSRLKESASYRELFWSVYRLNIGRALSPAESDAAYGAMTRAIAAFERTRAFSKFTSKFDYFMVSRTELTPFERRGLDLFNDKAGCAGCHVSTPTRSPNGSWTPAMFTDFTYDNIGLPRNLDIPGNPEPDKGLGGRADIKAADPKGLEIGKHKVMSLRNIAITPPFGHNGVFKTLEQITHFYNTRDTLGRVPSNRDPRFGVTGWPAPEVMQNVNFDELGSLGLTAQEEAAVVAFMKTLTDGYQIWGRDPRVPPTSPAPYGQ